MREHRLDLRALGAHARVPLGHVTSLGGVVAHAEAEARFPFFREHARDQRFVARREAQRMNVGEG
jgi:hypothetical protein